MRSWIIRALVLGVAITGCGALSPPTGEGLVVGGIVPCAGLALPSGEQYAAGTVTVLEGHETWRGTGPGNSVVVFPTAVAAKETVGKDSLYEFALKPGEYVLQAHFPQPGNAVPFVDVIVKSGDAEQVDIPNMCI